MLPNLTEGDYIFTSKITYKFREMKRGDVVVFRSPSNPDIEFIKRVMGLPGDRVMVLDGKVYLNERQLNETYIPASTPLAHNGYLKNGIPIIVPENQIFVMGDNREVSSDSRIFGPIPISSLIGQVFYRYFPIGKIGTFKNPIN